MAVPSTFADLSTTPASNSGLISDASTVNVIDDHFRTTYALIASIYANSGNGWSSSYLPASNPVYTGTLTGGTGIVNLGSGQFYKDGSGNVCVGTTTPIGAFTVAGSTAFSGNYTETSTSVTAASSTTLNCALGTVFNVTMSASITTLAFSNVPTTGRAYTMTLLLVQDATGSRTVTWPAAVKWASGTAPTLTTTANRADVVTLFTVNGGTTWLAFSALNFVYP